MKPPLIIITVHGGVVEDVSGVPDGFDYAVHDFDNAEAGGDCGLEDCQVHAPCSATAPCGTCPKCTRNTDCQKDCSPAKPCGFNCFHA